MQSGKHIDFEIKVGGKMYLGGSLIANTPPRIKPIRDEEATAGQGVQANKPIIGYEYQEAKFKLNKYPMGLHDMPIGEPIEIIMYDYLIDTDGDQSEHGIRYHLTTELDWGDEGERKPKGDKVEIEFTTANTRIHRKYVDDELQDEYVRDLNQPPMLNGKRMFPNRNRLLGR